VLLLACAAGNLASAENAAVLLAVAGGCLRNGPLAGLGLALAGYLGIYPLLLTVRVARGAGGARGNSAVRLPTS
jgi:hypothetical protein